VGYDGSGNVVAVVNAATGLVAASYEYDPFGNAIKATGECAERNVFRFSTKYTDRETNMVYYGYRYYQPQTGRWLSRDPMGERGGINLYQFVKNNPVKLSDPLGLFEIDVHYYLTYYLALKTGCFTDWFASQIAEGNQRADEDEDKLPAAGFKLGIGPRGGGLVPDWRQQQANMDFHAFGTHAQNAKRANQLYREAVSTGDPIRLGTYMHFLQDEFAHIDFAGNPATGQVRMGKKVDHTNWKPEWSMEMARATWEKLTQYARNRGCKCTGEMTPEDWKRVRKFVDVGYETSSKLGRLKDFGWDVSAEQLRRKVKILDGVPF
jgi:RHS repeat-associated protein